MGKSFTIIGMFLIMLLAVSCSQSPVEIKPVYTDMEEAQKVAASADKPLVIDFYSDTCPWCRKLDTVLADEKAVAFFTSEMVLVKLNGKEDTALSKSYHVSAYPTVVLLGTDGKEIDRIVGYRAVDVLLQTLTDYTNGIGTMDDKLAQYEKEPNRDLAYEIAEKYQDRGSSDEAREWFNNVIAGGEPTDSVSGECRMAIARMYRSDGDSEASKKEFEQIMVDFKGTAFASDAEVWRAYLIMKDNDTTGAIEAFEAFIKNHPESEDVEYAQKKIKELKGEADQK